MRKPLDILTLVTVIWAVSDPIGRLLPKQIVSLFQSWGISSGNDGLLPFPIAITVLFGIWLYSVAAPRFRARTMKNTYAEAREIIRIYRARRVAMKFGRFQIAKALLAMVTGIYFFGATPIVDYLMPPPDGIATLDVVQRLSKLFLVVIGMWFLATAAGHLRPLVIPAEEMRRRTERKVRAKLVKLGLPEEDQINPENGISQRLTKLDRGPILGGLWPQYGRRRRRGPLTRLAKFMAGVFREPL